MYLFLLSWLHRQFSYSIPFQGRYSNSWPKSVRKIYARTKTTLTKWRNLRKAGIMFAIMKEHRWTELWLLIRKKYVVIDFVQLGSLYCFWIVLSDVSLGKEEHVNLSHLVSYLDLYFETLKPLANHISVYWVSMTASSVLPSFSFAANQRRSHTRTLKNHWNKSQLLKVRIAGLETKLLYWSQKTLLSAVTCGSRTALTKILGGWWFVGSYFEL